MGVSWVATGRVGFTSRSIDRPLPWILKSARPRSTDTRQRGGLFSGVVHWKQGREQEGNACPCALCALYVW